MTPEVIPWMSPCLSQSMSFVLAGIGHPMKFRRGDVIRDQWIWLWIFLAAGTSRSLSVSDSRLSMAEADGMNWLSLIHI